MVVKKKKTKTKAKNVVKPAQDVLNKHVKNIPAISIGKLGRKNMLEYGSYTIYSRAIPMLYDGLKPVHRRIVFAMSKAGLVSSVAHRKAAKIVGDTMGNYHPHGDAAIYGAMVGLSTGNGNSPNALIDGQGNWGDFDGDGPFRGAAAYRYTEARLTKLATDNLVPKAYMDPEVIDYIPNFDGSLEEPLYLPSLLPMLFLLGAEGIATGVAVNMPSYTYESVISATKVLLKTGVGKKASRKLVPVQRWGAELLSEQSEIDAYHASGQGKLTWQAPYTIERTSTGTILKLTSLPLTKYNTLAESLIGNEKKAGTKGVSLMNLSSGKTGINIHIVVKDESVLTAVKKKLVGNDSYNSAVTLLVKSDDPEAPLKVAFEPWSPNVILEKWLDWRVTLEKRFIKSLIRDNDAEIKRLSLLVFAASNLDIIFAILKNKKADRDTKLGMLEKQLKITNEEARTIWQMTVGQLDALNAADMQARVSKLKAENKKLKIDYAKPTERILRAIDLLPISDPNAKMKKRKAAE